MSTYSNTRKKKPSLFGTEAEGILPHHLARFHLLPDFNGHLFGWGHDAFHLTLAGAHVQGFGQMAMVQIPNAKMGSCSCL